MTDIAEIKRLYGKMVADINLDDGKQKAFATRIKRAISWYDRAENEIKDADAKVIFFWIAFNALYGKDKGASADTRGRNDFLENICDLDKGRIHEGIKKGCREAYINIMSNRYIYKKYWDDVRNKLSVPDPGRSLEQKIEGELEEKWKSKEKSHEKKARQFIEKKYLGGSDVFPPLKELFYRIYELRNQIMHGSASWNKKLNRDQVENGRKVLEVLIPLFIWLVLKNRTSATAMLGREIYHPPYRRWSEREYFDLDSL